MLAVHTHCCAAVAVAEHPQRLPPRPCPASRVAWRVLQALSRNPESLFDNGEHPGPMAGINFWNSKMVDLGEILEQLHGPQIVKVRA